MNYGADWKQLRQERLEIDEFRCRGCNRTEEESGCPLEVHHRVYSWEVGRKIEVSDLTTFCCECHSVITNQRRKLRYSLKKKVKAKGVKRITPSSKVKENNNGISKVEVRNSGDKTIAHVIEQAKRSPG